MDETYETKEESGVSLKEIWCGIKKRIWLLLGISLLIAAVAATGFGFVINPRLAYYSMEFQIVYPSDALDKYPDGSPFYTYNIISKEALQEVKDGDSAFAKVDVEKMVERKDISLSEERGNFTIVVKGSYFANAKAGEAFVRAVVNRAIDGFIAKANGINNKLNEGVFNNASFEEKMQLMLELKNSIYSTYDAWINRFSATYEVNGEPLRTYRMALNLIYSESVQNALRSDMSDYGFDELYLNTEKLNDAAELEKAIEAKKEILDEEYKLNENKIAALSKQGEDPDTPEPATFSAQPYAEGEGSQTIVIESGNNASVSEKLASYIERNEQIDYQRKTTLKPDNIKAYAERIDEQYRHLCGAAETLTSVVEGIYQKNMNVHYETPRIEQNGTIGIILVTVGVFVVAFVVGAAVVFFKGRKKTLACADELPATEEEKSEAEENIQTE